MQFISDYWNFSWYIDNLINIMLQNTKKYVYILLVSIDNFVVRFSSLICFQDDFFMNNLLNYEYFINFYMLEFMILPFIHKLGHWLLTKNLNIKKNWLEKIAINIHAWSK